LCRPQHTDARARGQFERDGDRSAETLMQRFASCVDALDLMRGAVEFHRILAACVQAEVACPPSQRGDHDGTMARMTVARLKAAVGATRDRTAEVGRALPFAQRSRRSHMNWQLSAMTSHSKAPYSRRPFKRRLVQQATIRFATTNAASLAGRDPEGYGRCERLLLRLMDVRRRPFTTCNLGAMRNKPGSFQPRYFKLTSGRHFLAGSRR
jgi:hypothetical protein